MRRSATRPPVALRERTTRRVAAGRSWWAGSLPRSAGQRVRELDLDTHALALCAQQVLCTAPLVIAMSAVLQREADEGMGAITARFFGLRREAAAPVVELLGRSSSSISTTALVFSMITAIVFSTSVGAVQQRAFELIWGHDRRSGVRSYLRQLVWAVALGLFSLGMLFAGRLGRLLNRDVISTGFVTGAVLQAGLVFGFYLWSQHWLLHGRVSWRHLAAGAAAIAIGTAVMFRISRLIVPQQIIWQTHAYGLIGVAFVLSAWLMVLCLVIFGGALLGGLYTQRRTQRRTQRHAGADVLADVLLGDEMPEGAVADPAHDRLAVP